MKTAQIPVLIALAFGIFLSGIPNASAQYYIKKKKEQEEIIVPPVDEAAPAPETVEDPEADAEVYADTSSAPCTEKEMKAFQDMEKGFKAIERDPSGRTDEAKEMYDFLGKSENIDYMIDISARCKTSSNPATP